MNIKKIIKEWMLPIAMLTGASIYLIYYMLPESVHRIGPLLNDALGVIQPLLIFMMLFMTFCTIEPKDLKPHRWHWWLLLVQGGVFSLLGMAALAILKFLPGHSGNIVVLLESAMLCFICPTATAAAVVTRKLGGDVPGITTYIVLINILTALLVPIVIPLIQPENTLGFWVSFCMIVTKVFPLLITPCLCAWLVRYLMPRFHRKLLAYPDLPFYLWAVALTLAIAVTTKSIAHSSMSIGLILAMSLVSLLSCAFQFYIGRYIGNSYMGRGKDIRKITAGQSLGQKNTVFAIWLGYTFMTPETSIVGGLYSIWHKIYNSHQLRQASKKQS